MCGGRLRRARLAALPFPVRHPDAGQDPGLRGCWPAWLWILTFVRMTGLGWGCGVIGAAGCLESVAAELAALPFPVRHPDESQDPGLRGAVLLGSGS